MGVRMTEAEEVPASESHFEALLAEALRRRDDGEPLELEELAAGRAEIREALSDSLVLSGKVPGLHEALGQDGALSSHLLAGRYQLVRGIGAGSMGAVYAAVDRKLARTVAVKLLRSPFHRREKASARLLREAKSLAALSHQGIIGIHDLGTTESGEPFLVLDLLDGSSLADLNEIATEHRGVPNDTALLRRLEAEGFRLPYDRGSLALAVGWVAEVVEALAVAHDAGIVHRDVKPSNVFLTRGGRVVLLDFGLARHPEGEPLTESDATLGTPAYLAPEIVAGNREPGPAQDIYGATATLFHILTGRAPYQGSSTRVLASILREDPPRADKLRRGLPSDLQAILDTGMARDPRQRYATAAELAADLRAFLQHQPVTARRLTGLQRIGRRVARSRTVRGAAAAILIGGLLAAAMLGARAREARQIKAYQEAWRPVPRIFTLGLPDLRRLPEVGGARGHFQSVLDRAVELCDDPIPARLVRAAFRLDHGDSRGAAADMARVADYHRSDYGDALAAVYAGLSSDASAANTVDFTSLPEPRTPVDKVLAAFHRRRVDPRADVSALLADEALARYAPAIELDMLAHIFDLPELERRVELLEELYGGRTASTAGWLVLGYTAAEKMRLVVEQGEAAVERWPHLTTILQNLALAQRRLGNPARAAEALRLALVAKPGHLMKHELLARALIADGAWAEANEVIDRAPFAEDAAGRAKLATLRGELRIEHALSEEAMGRSLRTLSTAFEAKQAFDEAATAMGKAVRSPRAAIANVYAESAAPLYATWILGQAIAKTDDLPFRFTLSELFAAHLRIQEARLRELLFNALLQLYGEDPLNPRRIRFTLEMAPEVVSSDSDRRLLDTLRSLERAVRQRGDLVR